MGNQKKKQSESRIFSDHKKMGKTLIPPMRQFLGDSGMISWVDQILPELIWLAVIIENLGIKRGVEIGSKIAKLANEILPEEYFAFASSFNLLDNEQKQQLVKLLEDQNYLVEVRDSLRNLLQLYPECPLKFIDNDLEQLIETKAIMDFKKILARYYNRREQPAMIIQANVVYFAGICGKLRYVSNVQVPNLEVIISDFESDESKMVCSGVRATVNAFIGHISTKVSNIWPRYFWNRGIEIDPILEFQEPTKLSEQITHFIELADRGLEERWHKLPKDIYRNHQCEVIGALLARQVTLAKKMASNPSLWDVHIGPILLRVMVDNHITLAWILKDIDVRSKEFVLHGLGQAKLYLEHLKVENKGDIDPSIQSVIESMERWIDNQQYSFLTNVNLGSWSGSSTREMAEDADCLDLYRYAYLPFSSCVHNMWNHIGRLNVKRTRNPLHKYLLIPCDTEAEPEFSLLLNCSKYLQESFNIVDKTFDLKCTTLLPYDYWFAKEDNEQAEQNSENNKSPGLSSE
jgi:hypothetical protein